MKLDFEKAFDHVDHGFFWAMLISLKMDPFVITLIMGLVTNAKAKVHVNGIFTRSFPLERGVRQGDPMSPLLFAISSQPLMSILEAKIISGNMTGLTIQGNKSLLYQLIVDDVGLFLNNLLEEFENAREAIQVFEKIYGALLNVGKSVIVPLVNPDLQDWFASIGFQVLQPHFTTKYLGCLVGFNVSPTQETDFFLGKVQKRFNHWANRSLSFTGRSISYFGMCLEPCSSIT